MKKDLKVLFVDVDGTLYDNNNQVLYQENIAVLKELQEKGIDIFLCTGRTLKTLDHIKPCFPYFKGLIINNGLSVYIDNKLVLDEEMPLSTIKQIENYFTPCHIPLGYVGDNMVGVSYLTEEGKRNLEAFHMGNVVPISEKGFDGSFKVKQMWVFASREDLEIAKIKLNNVDIVNWPGNFGADIMNNGISKAHGIKFLMEYFGYKKEEMVAIGDGDNDVEMFNLVGLSLCMGECTNLARENADIILKRPEENGFAIGIKEAFALDK